MADTIEVGTDWQSIAERDPKDVAAEIDRLRSALRPFANYADASGKIPDNMKITNGSSMALRQLTMVDCRRAADALKR